MRRRRWNRWPVQCAKYLFAFGLLNASLMAAVIVPLSTAYAVTESLGWEAGLGRRIRELPLFYGTYGVLIFLSGLVILLSSSNLINIIIQAQVVNCALLPIELILMLILINRRRVMGKYRNTLWDNLVAWITTVVAGGLALYYFAQQIWSDDPSRLICCHGITPPCHRNRGIISPQSLYGALRKPLASGGDLGLTAALKGRHPAEIVSAMERLTLAESLAVFNWLENERAAEVLDELDPETVRYLIAHAPPGRVAALLDHLPMDDAAEVVSEAGPEAAAALLDGLTALAPADAAEVKRLLAYPDGSAGRLMTDKFAAVTPLLPASEALDYLRRNADILETINEVYVLDEAGHLLGVTPIHRILTAAPTQPVQEFMTADPICVMPETDQQEAAKLISRYDLLTLPIVSAAGQMLGIITIDDTIDVLVEGFNEDYLRSVGSDAEELERKTPLQIAKLRMPWLMATMLIELLAGVVIHVFDATLTRFILLASFMPIISAISGNTGLQSAAIIIRGLSSGQVQLAGWKHAVIRQLTTTIILGGACAGTLGVIGGIWAHQPVFGLVVFLGMFLAVNIAGVVGTVVPLLSKRAGFDPALTAGPFETAFQDVVGISIFLSLASGLLRWLT